MVNDVQCYTASAEECLELLLYFTPAEMWVSLLRNRWVNLIGLCIHALKVQKTKNLIYFELEIIVLAFRYCYPNYDNWKHISPRRAYSTPSKWRSCILVADRPS